MSCGISIYNLLSALGFRNCLLDSYAFQPPEPSYTLRNEALKNKTQIFQIMPLAEDSLESRDRIHLVASSLQLGSKLSNFQNSLSPKLDIRQTIIQSSFNENIEVRLSQMNLAREGGFTIHNDEISITSNSMSKSLLVQVDQQNHSAKKARKISHHDIINKYQKSTQYSDNQAKHYSNCLQPQNGRGTNENNQETLSYKEQRSSLLVNSFEIKTEEFKNKQDKSFQKHKYNPIESQKYPEYQLLLVSKEECSLFKLPELQQLSVKSYLLSSPKGNQFAAVFVEYTGNHSDQVILYSHGNSCDIGLCLDILLDLAYNLSINVFAYEYPGYGQSFNTYTSKINDIDIIEAAQTSYQFLINQMNFKWSDIILFGYSIGSGPTVTIGSMTAYPCRGIILQSAIASGLHTVFPKQKIKSKYDIFPNVELIRYIRAPTFIMHGKKDNIAPFICAQKMASMCQSLYDFWSVEDGDHFNLDLQKDLRDDYFYKLRDFLTFLENKFSQQNPQDIINSQRSKPWSQSFSHIYKDHLSFKTSEKHFECKIISRESEVQLSSRESS